MPKGMRYGYQFGFFNAINFQIAAGTPLILFAKELGASSTVLGIVAAILPLFTFLQLLSAGYLPRFGYRRFMLAGWGLRTLMVFALSVVPLLGFADAATKMALVLVLLVLFSILRGISVGVWMPWITELLPAEKRGVYLSGEQLAVHAGSLAALGICAVTLQFLPNPARYSAIFFLSALAGLTSLFALKKMPDAPASEVTRNSSQPVPWKAILDFLPFRKLLLFSSLWAICTNSLGIFTVAFTRETLRFEESNIVYLSLFLFIGALVTLPFTARFLQAVGMKGVLRFAMGITGCVILGWMLLAAGFGREQGWLVAALNLGLGVAYGNFAVANASLAMAVMPAMGRNHFFALYTVITSLLAALSPIFFGMLLDAMGGLNKKIGLWEINRYSLYFLTSLILLAIAGLTISLLKTHEIGELNRRDFTILASLRRFGRILQR